MSDRLPTYYLSHGGGPWPYMAGPHRQLFDKLEASLGELPGQLPVKPNAILVVSGHWEEKDFAVMANPNPPMVYDFGGFPREMYQIRYPALGSPELARRVHSLIQSAGLPTHLDPTRGFDHGTYALLAVTHPQADIPVIQVSIREDYDPEAHLQLGRALAPLRQEGVLIIGSGSSYHDLRAFMGNRAGKDPQRESAEFDSWLKQTLGRLDTRAALEAVDLVGTGTVRTRSPSARRPSRSSARRRRCSRNRSGRDHLPAG